MILDKELLLKILENIDLETLGDWIDLCGDISLKKNKFVCHFFSCFPFFFFFINLY
jgi:hypothetical protein